MRKTARKGGGTRRSRAQWSTLIAQYRGSALTQKAFCSTRGLAISSFSKALREAREESADTERSPAFVPVSVDSAVHHVEPSSTWDVELNLGAGIVLRVRGM